MTIKKCICCSLLFVIVLIVLTILTLLIIFPNLPYKLYNNFGFTDLKLTQIDQLNGEACLDGSPPGYYFAAGQGKNSSKLLIYFQGGGWCFFKVENPTEVPALDCLDRSKGPLGSLSYWSEYFPRFFGGGSIVSNIVSENPSFYDWNRLFIPYCDGAIHQGYRIEPYVVNGQNLYFRGSINTKSILKHAILEHDLENVELTVISGGSAGAMATLIWTDYIKSEFFNKSKVVSFPDSGMLFDEKNVKTNRYTSREQIQQLLKISNQDDVIPNQRCAAKYGKDEQWKCFFFDYMVDLLDGDYFWTQSLYDSIFLEHNLGHECISFVFNHLNNCNNTSRNQIEEFKNKLLNKLKISLKKNNQWGAFMPSCMWHMFTYAYLNNNEDWKIPQQQGVTLIQAFDNWIKSIVYKNESKEYVYIDNVNWPDNIPCSTYTLI